MKNLIKLTNVLILTMLLTTYSCSNDDDNTVVITLQDLNLTIDENPTNGQVVGTVLSDSNSTLIYSITSQTPNGALSINETTGELTVADATLFDFEINSTITATVSADEAENIANVTINLNNINELTIQDFSTTIDENPTNGDSLGIVQASGDGTLSYSITSQTPAGALSIDATTGELTVADTMLFDYETNPTVTATIAVDNSGNTQTLTATIDLTDLHEVGEYKFGGVIFWIDPASNNSSGLVCALTNLNVSSWGCAGVLTGATGVGIGTGETNTATIISTACVPSAAETISNLNWNGYNDWFLPSVDEFNEIAVNYDNYIWPTIQANGGNALVGTVWTSTEVNANDTYIAFLGGNAPIAFPKNVANIHVLPVRSWTDF